MTRFLCSTFVALLLGGPAHALEPALGKSVRPKSTSPVITKAKFYAVVGWKPHTGEAIRGWSQDGRYFGTCNWRCASRVDSFEIDCQVGQVEVGKITSFKNVDVKGWLAHQFVRGAPANSVVSLVKGMGLWAVGGIKGDAIARWGLRVRSGDVSVPIARGQSSGYESPHPMISVSPKGDAVAVHVFIDSGDHGCGVNQGNVVSMPDVVAEAWVKSGLRFHKKERYKKAISRYELALQVAPDYDKARYNIACAHGLLKAPAPAAAIMAALIKKDATHYRKRLREDPDFSSIREHPLIKALLK